MKTDPLVTVEPFAVQWPTAGRMLDCHANKVRLLAKQGLLDVVQLGADKRVTVASIRRFVESGGEVGAKPSKMPPRRKKKGVAQ